MEAKKLFVLVIIFSSVTFLSSCNNKSDDPNSRMDDTARQEQNQTTTQNSNETSQDANSEEKAPSTNDKPLTEDTKDGIKVNFPVGATEVSITGKIDGMNPVTYLMDVSKGQTITGSIEAVSESGKEQGNIRFSQIISPSGNADGPFGPTIKYDLTEAGTWKLIVNENQMSGDPWTGEFKMIIGIR